MPPTKKKTKKTATKKKARATKKKVSKKAKRPEDEEEDEEKAEDDEEEKAGNPFAEDDDEEEEKAEDEDEDEEKAEDDDDEEDDEEDDEDESKSLDALTARAIEDRKRLILAFTSSDLRAYAEKIIQDDPMITVKQARKKLLEKRCEMLGSGIGTPEPRPAGKKKPTKPQQKADTKTTDDGGIAALTHLIRGAN